MGALSLLKKFKSRQLVSSLGQSSSTTSHNNTFLTTTAAVSPPFILTKRSTLPYLALSIPEILEAIFAHLHQHHLLLVVPLVCKIWRATGRRYLCFVAHWNTESTDTFFKLQLQSADVLHCDFTIGAGDDAEGCEPESWAWLQLQGAVKDVAVKGGGGETHSRIQRLVLNGLKMSTVDVSLFSPLTMVTDLEFLNMLPVSAEVPTTVWLDHLLNMFPALQKIAIRYKRSSNHRVNQFYYILDHENEPTKEPSPSQIRRLILEKMTVDMSMLETFLCKVCPRLQDLRLIEVAVKTLSFSWQDPWNGTQFFEAVRASCPQLNSIHLCEPYTSNQNNTMALFSAFPTLKHWGSYGNLMGAWNFIFADLSMPFMVSLHAITTLEVYAVHDRMFRLQHLHRFLCKAVHLEHLIAPSVTFHEEFLEVIGDRSEKNLWACRGLKTLHMSFQLQNSPGKDQDRGNDRSRVLFAYIAKACPRLRDLEIRYSDLRMELEGGLCLLSELVDLERVVILTRSLYTMQEQDLDWIINPATRTQWQRLKRMNMLMQLKRGLDDTGGWFGSTSSDASSTRRPRNPGGDEYGSPKELLRAMERANCIEGVIDVLEELAATERRVWPNLERMWVRSRTSNPREWTQEIGLIVQLRPDLAGQRAPVLWSHTL